MRERGSKDLGRPVTEAEAERAIAEAARALLGSADPTLVSPDIAALSPYKVARPWTGTKMAAGVSEPHVVLLDANENALGPSKLAIAAASRALSDAHRYPDGRAGALREALAERHAVSPDRIVVGNGSNEIIDLLVRTFVGPGETVVTAWPSFALYRLVSQAHGREALIAPLREDRYDLAALAALVDRRTKMVFIANPNNPTGTYVSRRTLAAFLERLPRSVIVVLDEAYADYATAPDYPSGLRDFSGRPRLVVLRTFSKIYGLAGLRIGYGITDPELVEYMDAVRQPYNANRVAQAAALAALGDVEHVEASRRLVLEGVADLERDFSRLALFTVPTQANFMLVRLPCNAAEIVDALRLRGILVRDMLGYDMPDRFRVTIGTRAMNQELVSALEAVLKRR